MKSKISMLVFAICMVLVLTVGIFAADTVPDGYTAIANEAQLRALMGTSDTTKLAGKYFLTADIAIIGTDAQAPIGTSAAPFTGIFDGNGKTISNISLTGASNVGFFGATNGATIRNLTLSGNIDATGDNVGGFIGYAVGALTLTDCTNKINVNSIRVSADNSIGIRVGGLVGFVSKSTSVVVNIENCKNYGAVSGKNMVGGLVGRYESGKASTSGVTTVTSFQNYGNITATGVVSAKDASAYVGGMAGMFTNNAGGQATISNLYNKGEIKASEGKHAGGIVGYYRSYKTTAEMTDAFNEGKVYAKAGCVGGVIGSANGANVAHTIKRLYNAGEVTSDTAYFVGAVVGVGATKLVTADYYSSKQVATTAESNRSVTETIVTLADTAAANKALFGGIATSKAWVVTNAGPVLAWQHTHNFVDGVCTTCGGTDACKHSGSLIWEKSAEGTYSLVCRKCNETLLPAQSELPTVYINNTGSDDDLGTEKKPVLTLEEAVRRLTETGGSVFLQNRYTITKSIVLPEWEGKITFCSTTDANGNANNGFYFGFTSTIDTYNRFVDENVCLSLGGDAEFNNIVFKGNSPYKSEDSQGKDTVLGIAANWHNVDFTYIRFHDRARVFFVEGTRLSTESNTEVKDVTVNFYGPAASTGNPDGFVPFFHIVLGDWYGTGEPIDCSNKTVTLNMRKGKFTEGTVELVYTMSTHDYVGRKAGTSSNCATTINLYDASVIQKLRTGYRNVEEAAGTASLDSLTLNFNGNSAISQVALLRNVKNTVVNISDKANGRTTPMSGYFDFRAHGAFANETEPATVTAAYGTHSFADSVATPFDTATNGQGRYTLNATTSVECSDWTYANANGTYTRTCPTCGRTETVLTLAPVSTSATSAGNAVRFIAEMTFSADVTVEKYGMFITALEGQTVGSGSFADKNLAFAEGNDVAKAENGKLSFAVDLVGIPAEKGDTPIYAWAYVKLAGLDDLVVRSFDAVTANGLKK